MSPAFRALCLSLALVITSGCATPKKVEPVLFPPELSVASTTATLGVGHLGILQNQMQTILARAPHPDLISVSVREADSPLLAFEKDADLGRPPVSSQKILTTVAALDTLGPTFRYKTDVIASGRVDDKRKVLWGDLVIKGSGDPTFGGRYSPIPGNPASTFKHWAHDLRAVGVQRIDGSILVDSSAFDDEMLHLDWPEKQRAYGFMAPISALSFNENCVDLTLTAGWFRNSPAHIKLSPESKFYRKTQNSDVRTGLNDNVTSLSLRRQANGDLLLISGTIPTHSTLHERITIGHPAEYFGTVLRETLEKQKFPVGRPAVTSVKDAKNATKLTTGTKTILSYPSPPLLEITGMALKHNDNFITEMLFKSLSSKPATFNGAIDAVENFLAKRHINNWDPQIRDGSGLSRKNSLPANLITAVLQFAAQQNYGPAYENALATPGENGVLEDWFTDLRHSKGGHNMIQRIHAIHGQYAGAYDLSGYATSSEGQRFVFSFMVNDPSLKPEQARQLLERLTETLVRSKAVGKTPSGVIQK